MIQPQVQWVSPTPLWQPLADASDAETRAQMRQPQILRFATDSFMDEYTATLNNQPERLGEWIAQPETWRGPAAEPVPVEKLPPFVQRLHRLRLATASPVNGGSTALAVGTPVFDQGNLKLYQPAHMRFYLVSACLVCRIPGLPDRMLDFGDAERVTYVVRRLRPKGTTLPAAFNLNTCDEYALVNGNQWEKATGDELVPGEEQLPMFGTTYSERDGRRRRILSALVPVGSREKYFGAGAAPVLADDDEQLASPVDPRKAVLLREVTDPWRSIADQVDKAFQGVKADPPSEYKPPILPYTPEITARIDAEAIKARAIAEDQSNLFSWYILLDFGDYLEKYLPDLWKVITEVEGPNILDGFDAQADLLTMLQNASYTDPSTGVRLTLAEALVRIRQEEPNHWRDLLEGTDVRYSTAAGATPPTTPPFPDFRFPLHSPALKALVAPAVPGTPTLDDLVNAALQEVDAPDDTPPLPLAARISALDAREPGWFIIRCVFERPNCGPLKPVVMSEATRPFQLAAFFDPDAPARPIQINLPIDVSPGGLRKFDKNTAFVISDALACQMERVGSLNLGDLVLSVLPWPFHKDLPIKDQCAGIGMICSLSIPIITICALLLLMIIVSLLNIIFYWLPLFIICFPFPRFKAKES
jgi:hypothetical protein